MLINLNTLVLAILLLVNYAYQEQNLTKNATRLGRRHKGGHMNEYNFFENIVEDGAATQASVLTSSELVEEEHTKYNRGDKVQYGEIKGLLLQLLEKIREAEKDEKRFDDNLNSIENVSNATALSELTNSTASATADSRKQKKEQPDAPKSPSEPRAQRWGHWTDWSACSVSCGKGREIRWRHCTEHCNEAETEMEEKACQLPACSPGKLFGIKL